MQTDGQRQPNRLNRHVGGRIRVRRKVLGVSHAALARAAGVSSPQIRKFEDGSEKISAAQLSLIAQALRVGVAYFFEDLDMPDGADAAARAMASDLLATDEGPGLAERFPALSDDLRQRVLRLTKALAADDDED